MRLCRALVPPPPSPLLRHEEKKKEKALIVHLLAPGPNGVFALPSTINGRERGSIDQSIVR